MPHPSAPPPPRTLYSPQIQSRLPRFKLAAVLTSIETTGDMGCTRRSPAPAELDSAQKVAHHIRSVVLQLHDPSDNFDSYTGSSCDRTRFPHLQQCSPADDHFYCVLGTRRWLTPFREIERGFWKAPHHARLEFHSDHLYCGMWCQPEYCDASCLSFPHWGSGICAPCCEFPALCDLKECFLTG